ncbi:hypothetical protein BJX64DRAFT_261941 [Aspergillus heterothallicus]
MSAIATDPDSEATTLVQVTTVTVTAGEPAQSTESTTNSSPTTTTTTITTTITTSPTTSLSVLGLAFPDPSILDDFVGSVAQVDHADNRTTLVLDCAETGPTSCTNLSPLVPLTVTIAPTTFIYSWAWEGSGYSGLPQSATVTATERVGCGLVGTQTAACEIVYVTEYIDTSITTGTTSYMTVYSAEDFTYHAVPITAGVELLETDGAALSTATSTGGSAAETAASDSSSGAESDSGSGSGSGSKAWIAGPVIGAVVAIALIIGVVLFLRRRRQKLAAAANGVTSIAELPEKGVHKGELPAIEPAAAELSAVKGQNQIHELA